MPLIGTLEQFDIQLLDFFIVLAASGLVLFLVLATLCTPLFGLMTECVYTVRRKAFHDKCALQISQSALAVGLFILIVLVGGAAAAVYQLQPELLEPPLVWRPLIFLSPPLAALALLILYLASWRLLKKVRVLHVFFGLLPALLFLAVLFCGLLLLANMQQPMLFTLLWNDPLAVAIVLVEDFLQTPQLWALFGYLFCTGLAAGGALAQIWLILRRHKADYGRDYYTFAMHYCARFALAFTVFATGLAGGVYWLLRQSVPVELSQPHDPGILLIAAALPLCSCILWLVIGNSETPLRHKPGVFFACFFLYIALCAQILMLMTTFPQA